MLVIADVERPLVIAGVFGSVDAEVDEQTTDLVLEAANFSGPSILRTEMHTGIRSEASNRFEKGLDTNLVPGSLAFSSRLLAELCAGTVAPGTVDVAASRSAPPRVRYRPAKCDGLLGYAVAGGRAGRDAAPSGVRRRRRRRARPAPAPAPPALAWTVTPPSFRPDLGREVDLIEEVGRIAGYGQAPETLPGTAPPAGSRGRSRCGAPYGAPWSAAASTRSSPTASSRPTRWRRSDCPRATCASIPSG